MALFWSKPYGTIEHSRDRSPSGKKRIVRCSSSIYRGGIIDACGVGESSVSSSAMENLELFFYDLRRRLADGTPGVIHRAGYRQAAVLVPLIPAGRETELLLTERTHTVETHKGQVSFPGGVVDPGDAGATGTALRETYEELGIPAGAVEILGTLDGLVTPTGFVITPIVGVVRNLPPLTPNVREVADVLRVPLGFFADLHNAECEMREVEGMMVEVWSYRWKRHVIWGATAWIIRSLLRTIGWL